MSTPYIVPSVLNDAPTGCAWTIIPEPGASDAATAAEQLNICIRATSIVDTFCNQVLRATVDNEPLTGPGAPRVGIEPGSGNGLLCMRRWPVIDVLAIQIAQNKTWPRVWAPVPAGLYEPQSPLINQLADAAAATAPDGGSMIVVAPQYINWDFGRNSQRIMVSYTNGWPHTSLTVAATGGASIIDVDDVTGWAGASGFAYDGSDTESVSVLSVEANSPVALPNGVGTAQSGPGTLTLSAPLGFGHAAGVLVSALPANVMQATILVAAAQALESGIESITIQAMPGTQVSSAQGSAGLVATYKDFLQPYRRIV